jgi:hypothetical protein
MKLSLRLGFVLAFALLCIGAVKILHERILYSSPAASNNANKNYARLVELGTKAQDVYKLKNNINAEQTKIFVERRTEIIKELKEILREEIVVYDEFRPNTYKEHGRDIFLHFKPLAALLRELGEQSVQEKNTTLVFENACLLIDLGKAICYGGDMDDNEVSFAFRMQGTLILYKYFRTQPNDLEESHSKFFSGLRDRIESVSVTVDRNPDASVSKAVREMLLETQNNRNFVIYACFDMCRIAFELELYKKSSGKYPEKLEEVKSLSSILIDPWQQPYIYIPQENTYKLYSTGADQIDNKGHTKKNGFYLQADGDIDMNEL